MGNFHGNSVAAFKSNPLKNKEDLQTLINQLLHPLQNYFSSDKSLLQLGNTAAHYSKRVQGLEAFSRPLWGLAPLLAGGGKAPITESYVAGIKRGTNPDDEAFWGFPQDYDQRTVETAAFGLTLALSGPALLEKFAPDEKERLIDWLSIVNKRKTPDNNWNLFKVMVNTGFEKSGIPYDKAANEAAFASIENYYLGDGWYADGQTRQKDYYVSFAIHFYCLIYAQLMGDKDPERAKLFKDRAITFAGDFIYWFSADGSSIPFGRSMTYRFAQTAFWSTLAFANVEAVPWGVIKGIVLRHIRWWMKQPIFTSDGVLTIGYGYPNLIMSENYNAPGSPYWAFKSFLIAALSDDHPFWRAEEMALPKLNEIKMQKHAQMFLCRDRLHQHVFALTSGQYADFEPAHTPEKYAKFAYSNQFGFSVSKEVSSLTNGAFDSMLALSEKDDRQYRVRKTCEETEITSDFVYARWRPWKDVIVDTWLVPLDLWHVRIHRIQTKRALDTAEGGFAVAVDDPLNGNTARLENVASSSTGNSGILHLSGEREFRKVRTAPNTNMLYPDVSEIPTLFQTYEPGTHWLATAVLAHKDDGLFLSHWESPPQLMAEERGYKIIYEGKDIFIEVEKATV